VAQEYYKLSELMKAISVYKPPQTSTDLKASLNARIRIGGSGSYLADRLRDKSGNAKRYPIETLDAALVQERDPIRRLLYHNVLLRIDFSYARFLKAFRDLSQTPLSLVDQHASWYVLYVYRFTRMQSFGKSQWAKSGYLLRTMYNEMVAKARESYADLLDPDALEKPHTNGRPHYLIVTTEFVRDYHALTKQTLDLASALVTHHGAKVTILNASIPPRLPLGYLSDHTPPPFLDHLTGTRSTTHKDLSFGYVQNPNMMANAPTAAWFAAQLKDLKPDGVINIGPGNILMDSFSDRLPTLAFPNLGEVPFSSASKLCTIKALDPAEEALLKRAGTQADKVSVIPTAFQLPASSGTLDRDILGFPVGAKIALIVGLRLQTECRDGFLSILETAAQRHANLHFVFAGPMKETETWLKRYPHLNKKSKFLGFQDDVLYVTRACDLYINPFRQGGGTSAIYAMSAGVPVVSMAQGDVAEIFGKEECAATEADYVALLDDCVNDTDVRQRLIDHGRERWKVKSDMSRMADALVDLLSEQGAARQTVKLDFVLQTRPIAAA